MNFFENYNLKMNEVNQIEYFVGFYLIVKEKGIPLPDKRYYYSLSLSGKGKTELYRNLG